MKFLLLLVISLFITPLTTSAHEVYVLSPEVAAQAIHTPGFSLVDVALANLNSFLFWGLLAITLVTFIFFISISKTAENALDPLLAKLPPYAPLISRLTIGFALLAGAYHGALFGPELPLTTLYGSMSPVITGLLALTGLMIIVGWYTRLAALALIVIFMFEVSSQGWYMLTYANYFGELLLLLILGAHHVAFHHQGHDRRATRWLRQLKAQLAPLAFPLLRVSFGLSLFCTPHSMPK